MDYGLKGKVVLVNGSTGGIGQAICRAFAREGAKLAIASTSQAKLDAFVPTLDIAPEDLKTFVADATKAEEVKAWVDGAYNHFGHIDVVIPNAGYEGSYQEIQDCTVENYMKVYSINVFGPMLLMKYAAPYLLKQESGAIVTIASNGSYTTAAGMSAYCSSKHAVAGIAKSVALAILRHMKNVKRFSGQLIWIRDTANQKKLLIWLCSLHQMYLHILWDQVSVLMVEWMHFARR